MKTKTEKNRRMELKHEIENTFDHLANDEIEILAAEYDNSTTRMIEVIDIRTKSAMVMDLSEDIKFSPVAFPPAILSLLVRHDVFLATLGFRQKKWAVVYLSPPYETHSF